VKQEAPPPKADDDFEFVDDDIDMNEPAAADGDATEDEDDARTEASDLVSELSDEGGAPGQPRAAGARCQGDTAGGRPGHPAGAPGRGGTAGASAGAGSAASEKPVVPRMAFAMVTSNGAGVGLDS